MLYSNTSAFPGLKDSLWWAQEEESLPLDVVEIVLLRDAGFIERNIQK